MRLKAAAEPDFVFYRPFSSCLTTDLRYVDNWRAAEPAVPSGTTQLKGRGVSPERRRIFSMAAITAVTLIVLLVWHFAAHAHDHSRPELNS